MILETELYAINFLILYHMIQVILWFLLQQGK